MRRSHSACPAGWRFLSHIFTRYAARVLDREFGPDHHFPVITLFVVGVPAFAAFSFPLLAENRLL